MGSAAPATAVLHQGKATRIFRKEQRSTNKLFQELCQSRGGPSWAVRPNEPSVFRGRKDLLNPASALVTTCP